jgi:hypothetical protein
MPLSTVRNQLKVFERTLRRVLALKKAHTLNHIKFRKPLSGRLRKISMPSRIQEVIIQEGGRQLKNMQFTLTYVWTKEASKFTLTYF